MGVSNRPAPIPEDEAGQVARWLVAEQHKRRTMIRSGPTRKRAAHDALEKRRRAQEREGLPLEASPSMDATTTIMIMMRGWRSGWASSLRLGSDSSLPRWARLLARTCRCSGLRRLYLYSRRRHLSSQAYTLIRGGGGSGGAACQSTPGTNLRN